ncbi:MAG: response regulator [Patescibacteria group bacterium]
MKKVLIIEDDEAISRVYSIKLNQGKAETIIASDGEEGFKKITSEKPDLILLDLMLPNKDGFWVLEEIAKHAELKKIPVLILSNLGQQADIDRAMKLGAKDYFIKTSISVNEMAEKINKYL